MEILPDNCSIASAKAYEKFIGEIGCRQGRLLRFFAVERSFTPVGRVSAHWPALTRCYGGESLHEKAAAACCERRSRLARKLSAMRG